MDMFEVVWKIKLKGDSPEHAAKKALDIQRDTSREVTQYSDTTKFTVTEIDIDSNPISAPKVVSANDIVGSCNMCGMPITKRDRHVTNCGTFQVWCMDCASLKSGEMM